MLTLLSALFQFAVNLSDPSQTCSLTHREPYVAGTFYLYCSQMSPDGVEMITVGRFIPDDKAATAKAKATRQP